MNLRDQARGRDCQIRLVGVCNFDPATTVLAHYRLVGISGLGMKSPDHLGAWACANCHSYVDTHRDDETARAFLEGVLRTQHHLIREGKIK
jgi:hypothetical protein